MRANTSRVASSGDAALARYSASSSVAVHSASWAGWVMLALQAGADKVSPILASARTQGSAQ